MLRAQYVKGERERLLAKAFMIRVIVLMTLMTDAGIRDAVIALAGDLALIPDTPANRAAFGSVGTGDDSSPFPQMRALPLTDASTRGLLGMPHGPAGTDKAAAEQKLLDTALRDHPHLFTADRIWLMDRNYPGVRDCPLSSAPPRRGKPVRVRRSRWPRGIEATRPPAPGRAPGSRSPARSRCRPPPRGRR